jgi:hypothetical protein
LMWIKVDYAVVRLSRNRSPRLDAVWLAPRNTATQFGRA